MNEQHNERTESMQKVERTGVRQFAIAALLSSIVRTPSAIKPRSNYRGRTSEISLAGLRYAEEPQFKAGRNEPCPCGSGKKFKKCHGG